MLYLDHAATTATHPEVIKEMLPFFQDVYSNPSGRIGIDILKKRQHFFYHFRMRRCCSGMVQI